MPIGLVLFIFLTACVSDGIRKKSHKNDYPWLDSPDATEPANWIKENIRKDLSFFKDKKVNFEKADTCWGGHSGEIVRMSIKDNRVSWSGPAVKHGRLNPIEKTIENLLKRGLPDVTVWFSLGDGAPNDCDDPILVMSKTKGAGHENQLLFPDFEILAERYQVLMGKDITKVEKAFLDKKPKLIWRGATAQGRYTAQNYLSKSRVTLMQISHDHPDLVDAGFTIFVQGGESIPELQKYKAQRISYEKMLDQRYQLWIDGNTASYSDSGWRFFANSVTFKVQSDETQWYYDNLVPQVHYVPIKSDLSDLVDNIKYFNEHFDEAQAIAKQAREFALSHLTPEHNHNYLYHLLGEFSRIAGNH